MTTGVIGTLPKKQFFDNNGHLAVGYKLYTYLAGTTTNATTWQDQGLTSANTNPITLDARGECSLWLDPAQEYKLVLKTAGGTTIWTQDDVNGALSSADTLAQIQSSGANWLTGVAGVDTITATATPTPTAYTAGQVFRFVAAGANTGAVTLNVSSLGAKSITKNGATALVAGNIPSGAVVTVTYDGAQFQVQSIAGPITSSGLTVATTQRVVGRKTAGAGAPEECTLSEILDFIGSAAQGDILFRDAAAWARLGAGTSGQFLKTLGTGANPTWATVANGLTLGTPVNSTSGTSIDFTSIPAGTKRITVMFSGVSTSGASLPMIQLADSGTVRTTGYSGSVQYSASADFHNTGFLLAATAAYTGASTLYGQAVLTLMNSSSNIWAVSGIFGFSNSAIAVYLGGTKTLSGALDRVRLTTVGGADTFDAGSINIAYE